jgi:hypothetical protein
MKRTLLGTLLALALCSLAQAETATETAAEARTYEPVKSITALAGFRDFDVIANDTLILWTDRSHPYLVKLSIPSPDLKFAHAIRVESATKQVYARSDSVRIRGLRYPIAEIFKMTRDEARQLKQETGDA